MKTFSVVRNTLLMKVIGVYIKFILFVKEEMTIFSVRTVGDSTANSEEPTLDTNMDFMKIETSSLDAEELRFNPSTGTPNAPTSKNAQSKLLSGFKKRLTDSLVETGFHLQEPVTARNSNRYLSARFLYHHLQQKILRQFYTVK